MPEEPTTGDTPPGLFAKLGAALPVALAAVATTFAGMSTRAVPLREPEDPRVRELAEMIRERRPERELVAQAAAVPFPAIDAAIADAERAAERTDDEWGAVMKAADGLAAADPPAHAARFDL